MFRGFLWLKWLLFPGIDAATRKRMRLVRHFVEGPIATLDAGCGNGAFALAAARLGNVVLGIDSDRERVKRCEEFRNFLGIADAQCRFRTWDIYGLEGLGERFDQIICFETLEHLLGDAAALRALVAVLNPGGVLHLCTPHRLRALSYGERLSSSEDGGHVRLGYTFEQFEELLRPLACRVVVRDRVVGGVSQRLNDAIRWLIARPLGALPARARDPLAVVVFVLLYPLTVLDALSRQPPLCVYVKARKMGPSGAGPS